MPPCIPSVISEGVSDLKNDIVTLLIARLMMLRNDTRAESPANRIIELVITVVIAAVLYAALLVTYLADLQDPNSTMYAGSTAAPIVGIITVFYWLGVALLAVGMVKLGKD
jgi:hypothetical protein